MKDECEKINVAGARAIPLKVKNCGVLIEADDLVAAQAKRRRVQVVNRIEIASGMDLRSVSQIMVSEPTKYPFREGYEYVHVLCFTAASNTMALLIPYIYTPYLKQETAKEDTPDVVAASKEDRKAFVNNLKEWLFVTTSRARHTIKEYHAV